MYAIQFNKLYLAPVKVTLVKRDGINGDEDCAMGSGCRPTGKEEAVWENSTIMILLFSRTASTVQL